MKLTELLRLIWKHRRLLTLIPVLMGLLVVLLTRNPSYTYTSETTLYTGMASAGGLDLFSSLNNFTTNTAFDNFIGIVNTRETQEQVALGLLAQHLMLDKPDAKYLTENSYSELQSMTPEYIRSLIVTPETLDTASHAIRSDFPDFPLFEDSIKQECYRNTIRNLRSCMQQNDTNFVYKLLNYNHPHYSLYAISSIQAIRMESSDLVRLRFDSDDPGICQQTLKLFTVACISNYKKIKESRSETLIRYFEDEVRKASEKLKESEAAYLHFNEQNSIINFNEQTKTVTAAKENVEDVLNELYIKRAGAKAAIKRIEEKLDNKGSLIVKSTKILQMRNRLSEVNAKIASAELMEERGKTSASMNSLKNESKTLKQDIENTLNELYAGTNTTEGISVATLLDEWMKNVIVYEEANAAIEVQMQRKQDFKNQYAQYASKGTDILRVERDLNVAEQSYLKMLDGLNQAKLKIQDSELSGNIKAVDPPYFPLTPNPTKRKFLVLIAVILGFMLVLSVILFLEYFDNALKNPGKATKKIKLTMAGLIPKLTIQKSCKKYDNLLQRNLDRTLQQIDCFGPTTTNKPKVIVLMSTMNQEGKTTLGANLALRLIELNKQVIFLNYKQDTDEHYSRKHRNGIAALLGYSNRRIDCDHAFLNASKHLSELQYYKFDIPMGFATTNDWQELIPSEASVGDAPDFVLLEIPPVLRVQYPVNLLAQADEVVLVCRANRAWLTADEEIIAGITSLREKPPVFVLNGVEPEVVESIYGALHAD